MARALCVALLCACAALHSVLCEVSSDEVLSLPGFSGALPTRQFSGYLTPTDSSNKTKKFHYWFVESENDPASDPVVLWLNGGPGCSSLAGYFDELGPLHFNVSGDDLPDIPTLAVNPYAWNKIANVLYLESPAGVGFSYSLDPKTDYRTDDNQTALDNYGVLFSFFQAYPEYKKHDFYVAGESYAGIYVPTLVNTIKTMNEKLDDPDGQINLKGFMVGNGCTGNKVGSCGHETGIKIHMDFYHKHALISDGLYEELLEKCGDFSSIGIYCTEMINIVSQRIGNVNIYNIYEPCVSTLPPGVGKMRNPLKEHYLRHNPGPYYGPDECIDDHVENKYFDNPKVREAIHVESMEVTGSWRICTNKINYMNTLGSVLPMYPTLIKTYRTLIYNGDVDGCVPYVGDMSWTSGLNLPLKTAWRPWSVDNQVAGYVTEYDYNDFKFVTVKGSGHMVPQFRPKQAYAMFERFIKNMPF